MGVQTATTFEDVRKTAEQLGQQKLLQKFNVNYVETMLSSQFKYASPAQILDKLSRCDGIREELHQLEREMDKGLFTKLVKG